MIRAQVQPVNIKGCLLGISWRCFWVQSLVSTNLPPKFSIELTFQVHPRCTRNNLPIPLVYDPSIWRLSIPNIHWDPSVTVASMIIMHEKGIYAWNPINTSTVRGPRDGIDKTSKRTTILVNNQTRKWRVMFSTELSHGIMLNSSVRGVFWIISCISRFT